MTLEAKTETKNLRYTPGQEYVFLDMKFERPDNMKREVFFPDFLPWIDEMTAIEPYKLLCHEHHVVPEHWSRERNCDGFLFVNPDNTDEVWRNQYPEAHFGQMDDSQNWKVTKQTPKNMTGVQAARLLEEGENENLYLFGIRDGMKTLDTIKRNTKDLERKRESLIKKMDLIDLPEPELISIFGHEPSNEERLERILGKINAHFDYVKSVVENTLGYEVDYVQIFDGVNVFHHVLSDRPVSGNEPSVPVM